MDFPAALKPTNEPSDTMLLHAAVGNAWGCQSKSAPPTTEKRPRPVTVFALRRTEPAALVQYTGSVSSWKTEEVGFEVSGRVEYIIEPGSDVDGPQLNESGDRFLNQTGELIADSILCDLRQNWRVLRPGSARRRPDSLPQIVSCNKLCPSRSGQRKRL